MAEGGGVDNKMNSDKEAKRLQRKEHQKKVEMGLCEKVKKALPVGYVCKVCGAKEEHAIYDCPLNKGKKRKVSEAADGADVRGVQDEKEVKQVYISGLPFDMTVAKLLKVLQEYNCEGVKQPFGVHVVTFPDNKQKCKGIAFVTFVDKASAEGCSEKLRGISLNEAKPHVKVSCEMNRRKQEKEWKPPSDAKVSLSFNNTLKRGKNSHGQGGERVMRCYRCGGNHNPTECREERICYRCKSTGHLSAQCPSRPGGPKPLLPTSNSTIVSQKNTKITFDN